MYIEREGYYTIIQSITIQESMLSLSLYIHMYVYTYKYIYIYIYIYMYISAHRHSYVTAYSDLQYTYATFQHDML